MTFNPAEPRDEKGRWRLINALKEALAGLNNDKPSGKHHALMYIKAAHERAPAPVQAHLNAALRAKSYGAARANVRDALSELQGTTRKVRSGPLGHEPHGLSVRVAKDVAHGVSRELRQHDRPAPGLAIDLGMARMSLPDGHPARPAIGRAMGRMGGSKASAQAAMTNVHRTLGARTRLPDHVDTRHRRGAARRIFDRGLRPKVIS